MSTRTAENPKLVWTASQVVLISKEVERGVFVAAADDAPAKDRAAIYYRIQLSNAGTVTLVPKNPRGVYAVPARPASAGLSGRFATQQEGSLGERACGPRSPR